MSHDDLDRLAAQRSTGTLIDAVLETSLWTAAHRAEVAANCLDLFSISVPDAVVAEILASPPDLPGRESPYSTLFRYLRVHMRDQPAGTPPSLPRFGSGEAAAITLARFLKVSLLINEHRAAAYARTMGVDVVTVPTVIEALYRAGVIGRRATERKLELIAPITFGEFIRHAHIAVERNAREKGRS